jgi:hypothetical protein
MPLVPSCTIRASDVLASIEPRPRFGSHSPTWKKSGVPAGNVFGASTSGWALVEVTRPAWITRTDGENARSKVWPNSGVEPGARSASSA